MTSGTYSNDDIARAKRWLLRYRKSQDTLLVMQDSYKTAYERATKVTTTMSFTKASGGGV